MMICSGADFSSLLSVLLVQCDLPCSCCWIKRGVQRGVPRPPLAGHVTSSVLFVASSFRSSRRRPQEAHRFVPCHRPRAAVLPIPSLGEGRHCCCSVLLGRDVHAGGRTAVVHDGVAAGADLELVVCSAVPVPVVVVVVRPSFPFSFLKEGLSLHFFTITR